jgi:hypothetical protein
MAENIDAFKCSRSNSSPQGLFSKTMIGILQPGYLPWLGFFEQLYKSDIFVIYDDVQYEKNSWRNRNRIKTPNGPQWLTVPVLTRGRCFPQIKDVLINKNVIWKKKHIQAIKQNYSKTPFFEKYAENLFEILNRPWEKLVELNLELIYWISEKLGISTKILLSSELGISGSNIDRLIGIIKLLNGDLFYEGTAGKNYIDVNVFKEAGISVVFQDYAHPTYPQAYGDFVSHLSIIDLMFNCGPDSLDILAGL